MLVLPIEELLFFVCIPYACLFTYHFFSIFWEKRSFAVLNNYGVYSIMTLSFFVGLFNIEKQYTFYTSVFLFLSWFVFKVVLRKKWLGKFIAVYAVLLLPFSAVNGVLTGSMLPSPIVWYNDQENLDLRLGTIPIEDVFYGFLLILLFVFIYERNSENIKIA